MDQDEESETSPAAGPPATGERSDHRITPPGVDLPEAPERQEAPDEAKGQESEPAESAPDEGAAREREDDLS